MRKVVWVAALAAVALGGCAHKKTAGVMGHAGGPDEYMVARRAPLVIPPDYALTPPRPGAPRPQEADSSTQALQALFGGEAQNSRVENGVVQAAQTTQSAPGIRSDVGAADASVVDKGQTTRDILAAPAGAGQDATVTTSGGVSAGTAPAGQ